MSTFKLLDPVRINAPGTPCHGRPGVVIKDMGYQYPCYKVRLDIPVKDGDRNRQVWEVLGEQLTMLTI